MEGGGGGGWRIRADAMCGGAWLKKARLPLSQWQGTSRTAVAKQMKTRCGPASNSRHTHTHTRKIINKIRSEVCCWCFTGLFK